MKRFLLLAGIAAAPLGLAACGGYNDDQAYNKEGNAAYGEGADYNAAQGNAAYAQKAETAYAWPRGARIVEENGVVYRIDPGGTRVTLGPNDSRIVVENGVRYRVEPSGTRIRIDPQGVDLDVDLPDVDVGINEKGNPDVDVTNNKQ